MRNYLIGTLAVIILFLVSLVFKTQNTPVFTHFPVSEKIKGESSEPPLYLFLFFSKNNCTSCLEDVVSVLNGLSSPFQVLGVVPEDELEDETALRQKTGAMFRLSSFEQYRKYVPAYTPTLIGVSPTGEVLFTLPGISMKRKYFESFLISSYGGLYDLLKSDENATK